MAKTPTTKALAPLSKADADKPTYLQKMEDNGPIQTGDNFDNSDVSIPRIKLLQATSKECETFDEAKPGIFWHTGLDKPLGSELSFVVCSRNKKYLLVAPLEDGQGILARADDFKTWDRIGKWSVKFKDSKKLEEWSIDDKDVAASGLDQWGTSRAENPDSPPAATLFYDYLILLPDHLDLGPAVLSIARSGISRAKKGLNDKIKIHLDNGRPMQAVQFKAKAVDDTNTSNQNYKNYQFVGDGFVAEELYEQAVQYANSLVNFKVQGEEEAAAEEPQDGDTVRKPGAKGAGAKSKAY